VYKSGRPLHHLLGVRRYALGLFAGLLFGLCRFLRFHEIDLHHFAVTYRGHGTVVVISRTAEIGAQWSLNRRSDKHQVRRRPSTNNPRATSERLGHLRQLQTRYCARSYLCVPGHNRAREIS
jgi:hypothetical protein